MDRGAAPDALGRAKIPAVVLAGGLATRMGGGDKCLRILNGKPILDHVLDRLAGQAAPVAINANGDPERFADYNLLVLPDSLPDFPGPLAGVLAGMEWAAKQGFDHVVSVAADTPFFPLDLVDRLASAGGLALAATQGADRIWRQPTFGIWPVDLRDDLRAALQDGLRKIVIWTDGHGGGQVIWDAGDMDPFFNINTPEDIEKAAGFL